MTKDWLRRGADRKIRQTVRTMAIVTPPTGYEGVKHLNVEAVFGVPGGLFPGLAPALQWLRDTEGLAVQDCTAACRLVERFAIGSDGTS
ncbi:hypothetical protein [Nitratireductor aquibiodomus]|nr:hypothetical protein [Nitratireductor aquibiodomus]